MIFFSLTVRTATDGATAVFVRGVMRGMAITILIIAVLTDTAEAITRIRT